MTAEIVDVLVVDDDEDIRDLLKILLESEGYRVNVAADGEAAWRQLRNGKKPALILLDLMMPRMDGEQFLRRLRSSGLSNIAVVLLSANECTQEKATMLNATGCLKKPIELEQLLAIVSRLSRNPTGQPSKSP